MLSAGSYESKPFAPRKESHFTRTHTPTQSLGLQTHNKQLRYREFRGLKEGLAEKPPPRTKRPASRRKDYVKRCVQPLELQRQHAVRHAIAVGIKQQHRVAIHNVINQIK